MLNAHIKRHFKPEVSKKKQQKPSKGQKPPKPKPKEDPEIEAAEREERTLSSAAAQTIINSLLHVQTLKDPLINQAIQDMAISAYENAKSLANRSYTPIKALLSEYGLPDEIISKYEEKLRVEEEARERALALEEETRLLNEQKAAEEKEAKRSGSQRRGETLAVAVRSNSIEDENVQQLVPYAHRPQHVDYNKKALAAIGKIKREKEEREAHV